MAATSPSSNRTVIYALLGVAVIIAVVAVIVVLSGGRSGGSPAATIEPTKDQDALHTEVFQEAYAQLTLTAAAMGPTNQAIEISTMQAQLTALAQQNAVIPTIIPSEPPKVITATPEQPVLIVTATPTVVLIVTATPIADSTSASSADNGTSTQLVCLTLADLKKLGNVLQELESPQGVLAGAQIAFKQNWSAPPLWTLQRNGANVTSVVTGDVASAWSPDACRPLARQ